MGKSQRTKGAAGEREVCHLIRDTLGFDAKRNLTQTREGGFDIAVGPYRLEVKRRARIGQIYDWMDQAEASCDEKTRPAVIARADGKKWLAIMPVEEFLRLIGNEL